MNDRIWTCDLRGVTFASHAEFHVSTHIPCVIARICRLRTKTGSVGLQVLAPKRWERFTMRRSIARMLAIPTVSVSVLAGVALAAPSASATAKSDVGGTVTHTLTLSMLSAFQQAGLTLSAVSPGKESIDEANQTANFIYPVTGGNGDVTTLSGSVDAGGGIKISSSNGRSVTATHVVFYVASGTFDLTPVGTSTPMPWETVSGITTGGTTHQTYDATAMTLTPASAAYIDKALDSSLFTGGTGAPSVGSMSSAWDWE